MKKPLPKVAAVHDLSGLGRSSLMAVIPILNTKKIQVCPLPTAILSTHTGGFHHMHIRDLSDDIPPYLAHWRRLGLEFAGIYTGYLGSVRQIDMMKEFIRWAGAAHTRIVIDPVLGDSGKLYQAFDEQMCAGMRSLVRLADIITPNLTEAAILLKEDYPDGILSREQVKRWLYRLHEMGPAQVIMTGLRLDQNRVANVCYDGKKDQYYRVVSEYLPVFFPGTGDVFASVLVGDVITGKSVAQGMRDAAEFVCRCIKATLPDCQDVREGVFIERELDWLRHGRNELKLEKF